MCLAEGRRSRGGRLGRGSRKDDAEFGLVGLPVGWQLLPCKPHLKRQTHRA